VYWGRQNEKEEKVGGHETGTKNLAFPVDGELSHTGGEEKGQKGRDGRTEGIVAERTNIQITGSCLRGIEELLRETRRTGEEKGKNFGRLGGGSWGKSQGKFDTTKKPKNKGEPYFNAIPRFKRRVKNN